MGGHAFPHLNVVRLEKQAFGKFEQGAVESLENEMGDDFLFISIPSYRTKATFGDLDILFCEGQFSEVNDPTLRFCKALGATSFVRNGSVTSFAVPFFDGQYFQVDLIRVDIDEFEFAFGYFAYNDLGNLLGRIFHRAGFKLGHRGLTFVVREEGNSSHVLEEIVLTRKWKEALEIVGYDYNRWAKGFDTLEDVFKYAVSVPLANRTIFRLDETNHAARVRDRKRLTYQLFLEWVNDPANGVPTEESKPKQMLRKEMLNLMFEKFPKFKQQYVDAQSRALMRKQAQAAFNGDIVSGVTGLTDKQLGEFISQFIENVINPTGMTKVDWVLSRSPEEVKQQIQSFHGA
jgi:triphosphoribosyl-dephospho-CoA synthetase